MRFAVLGDIHLSDRPPSVRKESYADEILEKIRFCAQHAAEEDCQAIVCLGDIFHVKAPSRTSHRLVQAAHEALTSTGIPVRVVVGNHDLTGDRFDSLPQQPLGALLRMEGVDLLRGPDPDFPMYGIEYLLDWQTLPERLDEYAQWKAQTYPHHQTLLGMHAPIFPDHKTPPYDHIPAGELAQNVPHWTLIAYGHIHDPEGHWVPVHGRDVTVANYGAISRGSLHAETLKRKPRAYVWDSATAAIEPFDIPCKPVDEVFDMRTVEQSKEQAQRMTQFLDGVGSEQVTLTSIEAAAAQVDSENVTEAVKTTVKELLEWAQHQ